ncbi:MAG: Gfo/Idh/MocA family oxidoreductase [Verrucomicrobiota bacterium]
MIKSSKISRKEFLKASAALAGVFILPAHIALGKSSGQLPPSELISFAAIGIGKQGGQNITSLLSTGMTRLVAVCDAHLQDTEPQKVIAAHPKVPTFTDFREMLDRHGNEIDAVLIATPDHAHFSATMLAMSMGKHVYVQKPLAPTFGQCERLMKMEQKTGVVTQMGNQGHSGANYFQFKAWTEAGIIQDVRKIDAWFGANEILGLRGETFKQYPTDPLPEGLDWDQWIDGAPMIPYSLKIHPRLWRNWYDIGGGALGDWGAHIIDTAHRFLKLGLPEKITAVDRVGVNQFVFPKATTLRFDFPARETMPPCVINWYDGADNLPKVPNEYGDLTPSGERKPVKLDRSGKIIYGKDLIFRGTSHASTLRIIPRDKMIEVYDSLPKFGKEESRYITPGHFKNFVLACRGEETARSPFSISGPLCQVLNLGIIAQRLGGVLHFDRNKKRFTNNSHANTLLDPPPREGWEDYFKMV